MIYHRGSSNSLDGLADEVRQTCDTLGPHIGKLDGIVVRGMSGVTVGVPVSLALGIPLVIVRKPDEDCHQFADNYQHKTINGRKVHPGSRWLFLDDFEASGDTRRACEVAIVERGGHMVGRLCTAGQYLEIDGSANLGHPDATPHSC